MFRELSIIFNQVWQIQKQVMKSRLFDSHITFMHFVRRVVVEIVVNECGRYQIE